MNLFALIARLRRAFVAPLPLVGLLAAVGPLALSAGSVDSPAQQAEVAYRSLPELPEGSDDRGRDGVEKSAIALAVSLRAVPVDALAVCPSSDLVVSWEEPDPGFEVGAHVTPIGPAPTAATESVNGIVVCAGFDYGYMGFEAQWAGARWDIVAVPFVGEGEEDHLVAQPAPVIPQGPKPVPVLAVPGTVSGPIEGYAAYEPQRTCDATAKVGTKSLAGALLRDYPGSRNLGIVRGCGVGGRSEHKEGRAFDWGVNITNPNEKAAADAFVGALLATDADGNVQALARRMGVMYIIWNRQIWSSYRVREGWRPYSGASAHRDHIHMSLSWAGALGRTSFWSGTVPPDLPVASPNTSTVASSHGTARARTTGSGDTTSSSGRQRGHVDHGGRGRDHDDDASSSVHLSRDELRAGVQALWQGGEPPTEDEIHAWLVSVGVSDDDASRYASWAADHLARYAPRADDEEGDEADDHGDHGQQADDEANDEADDDLGDEERQARQDAERQARHEAEREREARHEAERAARHQAEAEREARHEAERAARHQADAEREALHEVERAARHQAERERRAADEAARQAERERRAAEEAQRRAEREQGGDDGDGHHGDGRGRGHGTTTTVPPTTTTTTVPPTTTTVPPTTTTVPPPTTTTVAPETTTTTAPPETTTTTAGG